MAVIVKYIVVRNGEEKMTFATKKEADAYDKMLDIADRLFDFLGSADLNLDEGQQDAISLLMAEKRDEVMPILRGIAQKKKPASAKAAPAKKTAPKTAAKKPAKAPAKNPAKAVKPKVAAKKR
jgi:dsDNA-binding SOS-regulon protein